MKILHVSDLHLCTDAGECGYGLTVLEAIVEQTRRLEVDLILFCGHLLDPDVDRLQLASVARDLLSELTCPGFYVPGPREPVEVARSILGDIEILAAPPFELVRAHADLEILALPDPASAAEYRNWLVPLKQTRWRLAIGQGGVATLSGSAAPGEERWVLDPNLFAHCQVDYAALGGTHSHHEPRRLDTALVGYAGSARVTSERELGERGMTLIELDDDITTRFVPLPSAGQYRRRDLLVELDGTATFSEDDDAVGAADWLEVVVHGSIGPGHTTEAVEAEATARWRRRVRRLGVDVSGVTRVADGPMESLAQRFVEHWSERSADAPAAEREMWLRARELGLRHLSGRVE